MLSRGTWQGGQTAGLTGRSRAGVDADRRRDPETHLTVVFTALAVTQFIEDRAGWSIKKFVHSARRYHTVQVGVGGQLVAAERSLPVDLRKALAQIA